ncbi:MAG: RnfABCDGE type electron transport complex subunit D [Bacteroidota bacterium]
MITAEKYPLSNPLSVLGRFFQKDARHFQIAYLSLFLVYGVFALGWDTEIPKLALNFGVCLLTQAVCIRLTGKKGWHSLKSALISSLGLCLLLKTNAVATCALAAVLTISSKFLIRIDKKHIFNPVNFGIIMTVLLTGDAWVSPGQWGSSVVALYFMGAAALLVLLKVGRIDTSLAFMASYLGLEFFRSVVYLGWPVDHFFHLVTNGTVLLFTFFMITDPMTTPNHPRARVIWAVLLGLLTFLFTHVFFVQSAAPLWALFVISPLTIAFDKIFIHKKYSWFS